MSPQAGVVLVNEIMPIIEATIPRVAKPGIGEDAEELIQDATASAAGMIDSMESAGKRPIAKSIAYYAIQRTKVGRRSYSAGTCDALSPATSIRRKISRTSMDKDHTDVTDGTSASLHDVMATPGDDPATEAARSLDWSLMISSLNKRERDVLAAIADGRPMKSLARKYKVSAPRITQIARDIGNKVRASWGPDTLADAIMEPSWIRGAIRAGLERLACRHERALNAAL